MIFRSNPKTLIFLSSVFTLSAFAFYHRACISRWTADFIERISADKDKLLVLELIDRIDSASLLVLREIDEVAAQLSIYESHIDPNNCEKHKSEKLLKFGKIRTQLSQISSDIDFIYAELDQVRGDKSVVDKRKRIVEKVNKMSKIVDGWMKGILS